MRETTNKDYGFFEDPSYQHLRKAISEDVAPLVIMVGSGASRPDGYPDWSGLRAILERALKGRISALLDADPKSNTSDIENTLQIADYWDFFRSAKAVLTKPTFNQIIKDSLGTIDNGTSETTGSVIRKLLTLNPKGLVTLNLDPVAGNVFSERAPGSMVVPIYGFDINRKWSLIADEKKFLVYLHGHISDPTTWVLGRDELSALTAQKAHSLFLNSLYASHTVLLVGISADDIAISSQLMSLKEADIDVNRVFWFTSRTDEKTREWARNASVQIIPYSASTNQAHTDALDALVENISTYSSDDDSRIPPKLNSISYGSQEFTHIEPDELAMKDPEFVRNYLASLMTVELSTVADDKKYEAFSKIAAEYDYPIQTRSFYRAPKENSRRFFGYELTFPPLGMGNFGTVYHAREASGKDVAVKIMHPHILQTQEMVGGFRRGSRSMNILTKREIEGIVPIISTYEMPPTVVMDFVSGNSLQELFSLSNHIPWRAKIRAISLSASIVDKCHKTEEIVLHRDLKPSNIMVTGLDYQTYDFDYLTILDFDMSWHKGSSEKDVVFESRDDFGYLAPEQTNPALIETSRSTKVDSFGLGMTLLALLTGKHPIPNMSLSIDYSKQVYSAARSGYGLRWKCLPNVIARLIIDSTTHHQIDRIPFSVFATRIEKVNATIIKNNSVLDNDIFCEEILARLSGGREYDWDDVEDRGFYILVGGVKVSVAVDERTLGVRVDISYQDAGSKQYQRRNELIGNSRSALEAVCRQEGYKISNLNIYHGSFESTVLISKSPTLDNVELICNHLSKPISFLQKIE